MTLLTLKSDNTFIVRYKTPCFIVLGSRVKQEEWGFKMVIYLSSMAEYLIVQLVL